MKTTMSCLTGLALSVAAVCVQAKDFAPAVIYDQAGKFDKSFNEAAFNGAERFRKETGLAYREGQVSNDAQKEQMLRNMARKGADIVVAVGFAYTQPVETVAKEFPQVKFTLIDAVAKGTNVQSIAFKEQEGSFLVGMLAAMKSKSGKVGYIGGMDVPLIRAFGCGYAQGARYARPKAELMQNMIGTTHAAFNDPSRGAELAKSQLDRGADVIFAAAALSNMGVIQSVKTGKALYVGVDSNQNYLAPGVVLTSMVKRVDNAVYQTLMDAKKGSWKPEVKLMGLKEGGVDWALDQYNRPLVTPQMEKTVQQARQDIISGKIKVVDYRVANSCPVK